MFVVFVVFVAAQTTPSLAAQKEAFKKEPTKSAAVVFETSAIPLEVLAPRKKKIDKKTNVAPAAAHEFMNVELEAPPVLNSPAKLKAEETAGVVVLMPPKTEPLYKKWWLWTIIGVAVSGAAATGIVLAVQPKAQPPPDFSATLHFAR